MGLISVDISVKMRLLVLFLTSALVCLSSSQLCLDEMEVAAACVAQTDLSYRLMAAVSQCEGGYGSGYGGYGSGYESGYYNGYGSGYESGYYSGYGSGYGSGYYGSGYSGYGSGYGSGYYGSGYGGYGSGYDSGYYGSGYGSGYYGSGYGGGYYGRKVERKGMGEDWHNVLTRLALERQSHCYSASEITEYFHEYMSHDLCIWEKIGWYNLSSIGWIDFNRYQQDIDSLAPSVSSELSWSSKMGECWGNSTSDLNQYFSECQYSSEDWSTITNIIYSWADMTCFYPIFQEACTNFLREQIYHYSFGSNPEYYHSSGYGSSSNYYYSSGYGG